MYVGESSIDNRDQPSLNQILERPQTVQTFRVTDYEQAEEKPIRPPFSRETQRTKAQSNHEVSMERDEMGLENQ